MTLDIPAGFTPHTRKSPVTDPWEPIYARHDEGVVFLGLPLDRPHTNSRGFVHGGLISALADNAMGLSCAQRHEQLGGLVTVNLNVDFFGSARIGQWLEFRTTFVRTGRTLDVAQCFVSADDEDCARANATFRVLAARA